MAQLLVTEYVKLYRKYTQKYAVSAKCKGNFIITCLFQNLVETDLGLLKTVIIQSGPAKVLQWQTSTQYYRQQTLNGRIGFIVD